MASSNSDNHQSELIQRYASYPFDSDAAFKVAYQSNVVDKDLIPLKKGLDDILSRSAADIDRNEIVRKARLFYFNRITGGGLTFEDVAAAEEGVRHAVDSSKEKSRAPVQASAVLGNPETEQEQEGKEEPTVLTLAQIKEFIETGRTDQLPNNKVIPDGLNEKPPTESVAPARKKPWEVE
ncbi:hypothetical protein PM082_008027 [Marasmius tenuissimus]|nr:hypothetical protein PM082_008027 [Marasmius tenuissimus]